MNINLLFYSTDSVTVKGQIEVVNSPETVGLEKKLTLTSGGRWGPPRVWEGIVYTPLGTLVSDSNTQLYAFAGPFGEGFPRSFSVSATAGPSNIPAVNNDAGSYEKRSSFGAALLASAIRPDGSPAPSSSVVSSTVASSATSSATLSADASASSSTSSPTANRNGSSSSQPAATTSPASSQKSSSIFGIDTGPHLLSMIIGIAAMAVLVCLVLGVLLWRQQRRVKNARRSQTAALDSKLPVVEAEAAAAAAGLAPHTHHQQGLHNNLEQPYFQNNLYDHRHQRQSNVAPSNMIDVAAVASDAKSRMVVSQEVRKPPVINPANNHRSTVTYSNDTDSTATAVARATVASIAPPVAPPPQTLVQPNRQQPIIYSQPILQALQKHPYHNQEQPSYSPNDYQYSPMENHMGESPVQADPPIHFPQPYQSRPNLSLPELHFNSISNPSLSKGWKWGPDSALEPASGGAYTGKPTSTHHH
ncbi:hypothetical protein BASA50_009414 [Batrachochytrium salamandrivorans]|uniref:Uncharacterized protein n=1 Tax=Batrachochytrium salamandrivorans TaxID=1357716 RepID=A0ABQ8F1M4_9FUNG|nr:hypothetical protein BASA60_002372 [Batrachochytrium salamandrivorans]KAH6590439.1 hypothetical protein BASA50_009414 [Batrachochytrium salamandrivorans]KAH6594119.1 hypothetical protein BASA61_004108 [Batrachochytrium salamandrivorans]